MAGSVSGIKAGNAFVLIEAVDATGKVLNSIRNRLGKFGTEMSNIGRTMALRAIGALTPAAFAIKSGTTYDDIMRKVEARSEGTATEMNILKDATLKLGRALGLLPSGVGKIQNIFAQAGFNRKEIASIAPAVGVLARAGGEGVDTMVDMENAAKAVGSVLRGFEMDASQSGMVVDKLAIALNQSNFNLEDITTALQFAVPAARNFNISLDEMLSILGAMRDLQIDASIAGTAFRNMGQYMSDVKSQEKFNEKLKNLTGNTIQFTDALGNLESPMKLLPAIMKATEGLGTGARSDVISELLQMRVTTPGMAVGRSMDRMAQMMVRLKDYHGAGQRIQKFMDSGLGGAFRRFGATVEETSIKFQKVMAPALESATKGLDQLLKVGGDWIIQNPKLITGAVAFAAGMLALGTALVVAGQATIAISALFGLGGAIASAAAAVATFVGPWALVAIGIYAAVNAIDDFRGHSGETMSIVSDGFTKMASDIYGSTEDIRTSFSDFTSHVASDWQKSIDSITSSLASGDVINAIRTLGAQMAVTWQESANKLMDIWDTAMFNISQMTSGSFAIAYAKADLYLLKVMRDSGLPIPGRNAYGNAKTWEQAIEKQEEYIGHLQDTVVNKAEDNPANEARRAAKANRDARLGSLKNDLEWQRHNAAVDQELAKYKAYLESLMIPSGKPDYADELARMEYEAAKLVSAGGVDRIVPPKGAVEGLDIRSVESMKQFLENKYNLNEAMEELTRESRDHLANIDRKTGEGADVVGV